jgi:hypothetical protein
VSSVVKSPENRHLGSETLDYLPLPFLKAVDDMRRTNARLLAMLRRFGVLFRDEHLDIAVSHR